MNTTIPSPLKDFNGLVAASKSPTMQIFWVEASGMNVEYLLSLNTKNRLPRDSHISWMSDMISRGEFFPTGQGITVSTEQRLQDGQHRLMAFRKAGYPAGNYIAITTGADPKAGAMIDLGVKRTAADAMKFVFDRPEATSRMMAVCNFFGQKKRGKTSRKLSPMDQFETYEMLKPAIEKLWESSKVSNLPAPVLCALAEALLAPKVSVDKVLDFAQRISTGADCSKGSPELSLRLFLNKGASGTSGSTTMQEARYTKTVQALDAFLQGKTLVRGLNAKTPAWATPVEIAA
jgi:hypothetical protein